MKQKQNKNVSRTPQTDLLNIIERQIHAAIQQNEDRKKQEKLDAISAHNRKVAHDMQNARNVRAAEIKAEIARLHLELACLGVEDAKGGIEQFG